MTDAEILWPCKFCGGEAAPIRFERISGGQEYSVMCRRCGVGLFLPDLEHASETALFPTLTAAIEAWNRRPDDG